MSEGFGAGCQLSSAPAACRHSDAHRVASALAVLLLAITGASLSGPRVAVGASVDRSLDATLAATARQQRAESATPEARARRAASRQAYRNKPDTSAIRVIRQRFPQTFGSPAWTPVSLPRGEEILRYLNDHSMVVGRADGAGGWLRHAVRATETSSRWWRNRGPSMRQAARSPLLRRSPGTP